MNSDPCNGFHDWPPPATTPVSAVTQCERPPALTTEELISTLQDLEAKLIAIQNCPFNTARYDLRVALRSVRNARAEVAMELSRQLQHSQNVP